MKKSILVTGSHRSGSTWTGKVISKAPKVRYIQEPFNIAIKRYKPPFKYWFQYITSDVKHQQDVKNYIDSFLRIFHISSLTRLFKVRTVKGIYGHFLDLKRRATDRTIIKDPIAIMSTEWLYNNYNLDVVIIIRHPAAFVASLKVKKWEFDFNNYLNQPMLMKSYLKDYEDEINDFSRNQKDIIDQGILLWKTIYGTVSYYKEKYKDDWCFVKHEDLSINPIEEFKNIFSKINLTFSDNVKSYIFETTNSGLKSDLKRNSKENVKTWKNRLTEEEIARVKIGTKPVWENFYTENDW